MSFPERRAVATPQRWAPLRDIEQFAERMRRMLDDTFGDVMTEAAAWVPPVDIEETDDAYAVEAKLPGVRQDEIDIELIGNELMITGEIKEKERAGVLRRRTRRVGGYELRVLLPDQVDATNIDANLKEGVLTVRVPKAERAQRKKIEVKS